MLMSMVFMQMRAFQHRVFHYHCLLWASREQGNTLPIHNPIYYIPLFLTNSHAALSSKVSEVLSYWFFVGNKETCSIIMGIIFPENL